MYKYSLLFLVFLLNSCSNDNFPNTYNLDKVELGEYGFFVIEVDNVLTEVPEIAEYISNDYEDDIVQVLLESQPINSITLESESLATLTSGVDNISATYTMNGDILTFENSVQMRLSDNRLDFCTQLLLAANGPLSSSRDGDYGILLFDTCDDFIPYNDALKLRTSEYFIGDTIFFAQPLIQFK